MPSINVGYVRHFRSNHNTEYEVKIVTRAACYALPQNDPIVCKIRYEEIRYSIVV